MTLKIYNTLSREKEVFKPLQDKKVKMYTCGPTVYNYIHIGNARMAVFFDVVRRYFNFLGYEVTYIQNITDVDDRIIKTSKESGIPEKEISSKYSDEYNHDLNFLNVLSPTVQPKVTEHIPQIIEFISNLIQKEVAYEINGDVYFRVERFDDYGKLTNQTLENLRHTTREDVEVIDYKENEHDFALWKKRKSDEIAWESPWGKGRPGWHIECSAMSMQYLGETFDIHGGGLDLCFPHHENEIAQSEALNEKPLSNYWMHNNYVTVNGQKMSKSLGNFTTVRDASKKYDGETIRYFFLTVNYRNLIDYSEVALAQSKIELNKLKTTVNNLYFLMDKNDGIELRSEVQTLIGDAIEGFKEAMNNDFDTSNAIRILLEYAKRVNILIEDGLLTNSEINVILVTFSELGKVLGFDLTPKNELLDEEVERLIEQRQLLKSEAMSEKDREKKKFLFAKADGIRNELKEKGISLEDTANGVRWKRT